MLRYFPNNWTLLLAVLVWTATSGATPLLRPVVPSGPIGIGEEFDVEVEVEGSEDLFGVAFALDYPAERLAWVSTSIGPFLGTDAVALDTTMSGNVQVGVTRKVGQGGVSGSGTVAVIRFAVLSTSERSVTLAVAGIAAFDADKNAVAIRPQSASLTLSPGSDGPCRRSQVGANSPFTASVEPVRAFASPGGIIHITLSAQNTIEAKSTLITASYDPALFSFGEFVPGDLIPELVTLPGIPQTGEDGLNTIQGGGTQLGDTPGSGDGTLGSLGFEVIGELPATGAFISIIEVQANASATDRDILTCEEGEFGVEILSCSPLPGDLDGDADVDFNDFFIFADCFGKICDDPDFCPCADLDGDCVIGFNDFLIFADNFGKRGQSKLFALAQEYLGLPVSPRLEQNFPNPFNNSTLIQYQIVESGFVQLDIFNLKGQRIKSLINDHQKEGSHRISWEGTDEQGFAVSTGVYLTRLRAGDFTAVEKMMFVR